MQTDAPPMQGAVRQPHWEQPRWDHEQRRDGCAGWAVLATTVHPLHREGLHVQT